MAPARSSTRRNQPDQNAVHSRPAMPDTTMLAPDMPINTMLFLEPMLGTPLQIYIEKDVDDRELLVELISKHGGAISPGYSGVPYILVDPYKESGQNLYRQYAGKKGKIVLNSRWVHECISVGTLQTFHTNWAGCKITGSEKVNVVVPQVPAAPPAISSPEDQSQASHSNPQPQPMQPQPLSTNMQAMPPPSIDPLVHAQHPFAYPVFTHHLNAPPRTLHPPTAGPPQSWQAPNGIAPQQTHIAPPQPPPGILHRPSYRDEAWEASFTQANMVGGSGAPPFDYRYRDDQTAWVADATDYTYDPSSVTSYEHAYDQAASYISEAGPSTAGPATLPPDTTDKPRGRKRTRNQPTAAATPSTLVLNRKNPAARSPTPPTRVIKSTYGGNLFTAEDVEYLKKYIDYCQEQGLVLSLREICERIAIKAPHHTFYSWRRYCNKHQIRLGGYSMDIGNTDSPQEGEHDIEEEEQLRAAPGPGIIAAAQQRIQQDADRPRNRSPTPPHALYRSTTGKGVAFTKEDITFLVRFMEYRKSQNRLDMVAFWKDVAIKAPHHSRASWMKFWRRHKHELNRTETDEPLPQPPEKKMRYSRADDILLAKYFFGKPEGTSDKIFQAFGRLHPHHPWKGWQEHHRIHKAKIDHFMHQLANGEVIDENEPNPPEG